MKKLFKLIISLSLTVAVVFGCIGGSCFIKVGADTAGSYYEKTPKGSDETRYWDLLEQYESFGLKDYVGDDLKLSLKPAQTVVRQVYDGVNAIVWNEEATAVEWQINAPADALYNVEVDYYLFNDKSVDAQRELVVDGSVACMEWSNIRFTRLFEDDGDVRTDINGDETPPRLKQVYSWQTTRLYDYNRYYSEPLKIHLTKGIHTISFNMKGSQPMAVSEIRLTAPEKIKSYSEVNEEYRKNGYVSSDTAPVIIEGEASLYRSASSLRLENSGDLTCTPSSFKNSKVNIAGGSSWKSSGQKITWQLDVPQDGLYKLGFNLYSYYNYGLASYRRIEIDGKVPFAELSSYCFLPSSKWRTEYFKDNSDNPYLFYLTEGKHTFSMSIVAGELTTVIKQLNRDMEILSDLYLDITFVTTSDPDVNYDYQLEKRIPGLVKTLKELRNNLLSSADLIKEICRNNKALTYSEMLNTIEDYEVLIEDVFGIPANLTTFTTIITQYGNWMDQLKASTLSVDKIMLVPQNTDYKTEKVPVYKRILHTVVSFISTFTKDYSSVIGDGVYDEKAKTIDVWYGGSQIAATEIEDLIESDFAAETGIQVKFKLTPASQMATGINAMLLAIVSGTAPDVVLNAASVEDYMMRNQCYDLKKFKDFDDFKKNFPEVCFTPLTYRGGVYAVPLTIDMNLMFYRTDIFKKLGISVPETWNEMIKTTVPKLAENNMNLAQSPGFEVLLYQYGGELYNEDMTESLVASQTAYKAFKLHCDFYTMYGVPISVNFFNRFRTGESPIGFGNLATYIQFVYAAPELTGKWNVAVLPGVEREDGTINHNIGGLTTSSAMIMADTDSPEEAWRFLKWYTSANVQLQLSDMLEADLDMSARVISANSEAFKALDWDNEHLRVFLESMKETKAYNPVLGSYYTTRYIGYAFNNAVISQTMTEREALEYAQENINTELERRRNSGS